MAISGEGGGWDEDGGLGLVVQVGLLGGWDERWIGLGCSSRVIYIKSGERDIPYCGGGGSRELRR